jgi:hypothetical protein
VKRLLATIFYGRWHASRPPGIRKVRHFLYLTPVEFRARD